MVRKARAIYDCKADDETELSFNKKAIIVDIDESNDEGWYKGTLEVYDGNSLQNQPKLPPKPPPRKPSNTNGIKDNSKPLFNSVDPVNNSGTTEISLSKPNKLSDDKFDIFKQSNIKNSNNNNNVKPSQKSPPIIKPKPKPVNKNSSSRSVESNLDEQEHVVLVESVYVYEMKTKLEGKVRGPLNAPPITPKPGKLPPPLPSKPSSTNNETDKKPPLPPRNQPNTSNNNDVPPSTPHKSINNDVPPPIPPRSINNDVPPPTPHRSINNVSPPTPPRPSSNSNSYLTKATSKVRSDTQDVAGKTAKQGVSAGVAQMKDDLNRSKYGKKIPGQDVLIDKAEKKAQNIAHDQAEKKVGEIFDKNTNEIVNKSTSKPIIPSRNNNNIINNQKPPSLPTRNTDIKIPPRPTSHANNPFSENDLSQGILPDARKRYEIIFDANKDDDDCIDGAVVKAIYLRSRLDNKTLFKIWNLLDNDEDGRLSRNEFCIGMFLIDERLRGHPVPDELPQELLE